MDTDEKVCEVVRPVTLKLGKINKQDKTYANLATGSRSKTDSPNDYLKQSS